MKSLVVILIAFTIGNINAQTTAGGGDLTASGVAGSIIGNANPSNGFIIINPAKRRVDGSNYLFDSWDNFCEIVTVENERFGVRNVNLNIKRNTVEAKYAGDSIFVFNFNNIKKFIINGETFKNYYWDDDNRLYNVIHESEDFALIKGYKITEVEASANPMLNRSFDRLIKKTFYYLKTKEGIKPIVLNKRKVLNFISEDEDIKNNVEEYARHNRLSYKNEEDLKKILDYSAKN